LLLTRQSPITIKTIQATTVRLVALVTISVTFLTRRSPISLTTHQAATIHLVALNTFWYVTFIVTIITQKLSEQLLHFPSLRLHPDKSHEELQRLVQCSPQKPGSQHKTTTENNQHFKLAKLIKSTIN